MAVADELAHDDPESGLSVRQDAYDLEPLPGARERDARWARAGIVGIGVVRAMG